MKKALFTIIAFSCLLKLSAQEVSTEQKVRKLFVGIDYNTEARIVNLQDGDEFNRRSLGMFGSLRMQVGYQFDPLNSISVGSGLARIISIPTTRQFLFPHHIEYRRFLKNQPKSLYLQIQAISFGRINPPGFWNVERSRDLQFNVGVGKRIISSKVQFLPYFAIGFADQLFIIDGNRTTTSGMSFNIGLRFIVPKSGGLFILD